jgi:hypothetical protein
VGVGDHDLTRDEDGGLRVDLEVGPSERHLVFDARDDTARRGQTGVVEPLRRVEQHRAVCTRPHRTHGVRREPEPVCVGGGSHERRAVEAAGNLSRDDREHVVVTAPRDRMEEADGGRDGHRAQSQGSSRTRERRDRDAGEHGCGGEHEAEVAGERRVLQDVHGAEEQHRAERDHGRRSSSLVVEDRGESEGPEHEQGPVRVPHLCGACPCRDDERYQPDSGDGRVLEATVGYQRRDRCDGREQRHECEKPPVRYSDGCPHDCKDERCGEERRGGRPSELTAGRIAAERDDAGDDREDGDLGSGRDREPGQYAAQPRTAVDERECGRQDERLRQRVGAREA